MKQQVYVIQYHKGDDVKTSAPMTLKVAEKQLQLLRDNGYDASLQHVWMESSSAPWGNEFEP
jgi:hypothetical protein